MADNYELASKFFKLHGFNRNQMESFNDFVERKLKEIVLGANVITSTVDPTVYLRYLDARIGIPPHRPRECRLTDRTYDAPIEVIIEYISERTKIEKKVTIGNMPIMLRSSRCMLHGKDEDELTYLGECPLDTGGYFVIRGTEKVILIQEQPRKNNIMIDIDKMGRVQASVISSTKKTESTTVIRVEKEKIYLKSDQFKRKVPILIFMRAMGIESDLEVLILIGGDKDMRFADLLLPSIEECRDEKVYTQLQALKFLESETMLKVSSHSTGPVEEGARALRVLRDIIFAHIPVHQNNFHGKCTYVAVILRRVMEAILNKDAVDDKDYLGNKRYELCGDLLSLRFEHLFMQLNNETRKTVDALLLKQKKVDMSQLIVRQTITVGMEISLSTGNWDSKQGRMHSKGVTQVVSRSSYAGLLAQMTRIVAQVEKSSEVSARQLHGSQFGMLCPCDTPIGESCGLVKHLALMAHVTLTIDEDESSIVFLQLCFSLGVEDLQYGSPELHMPTSYLIILNGAPIGTHRSPQIFANTMRKLRRKGRIGKFVSIFVNEKQGCVYIASDGGRVCRPLVIAEKGVSRIKEHHMNELKDGVRDFSSFLGDGLIEFLDVAEENNSLIAQCKREINPETTHIEIELFTTLGVCAGMIPYFDHNPSVSNTRQCAMGRKVMGNISYNQLSRMDTLMNLLVYPQRPLLTTRTAELVGYDKLGAGQNAIVAVMSDGYGSGNAIIMNKSSLDRGFGRCIVMKRYSAISRKYENLTSDRIVRPQREGKEAEIMQLIVRQTITVGMEISLSTGNWDSKQGRMHSKGVTQVVSRSSYAGLLAQMTRIVAQVEKSSEVSARQLHGSQFGMLCPCDTPIGESCGLVKHLALMAHVTLTIDEDESSIVFLQLCFSLGVEDLQYGSPELHMPTSYLIILNGAPIGTHRSPQIFANTMRKLRRKGRIGKFVSIFVNEKQGCVYIASDGGRVCRPLVIAEKGVSRIKEHHMNELKDGVRDFSSFLGDGLIEFLDVAEENNSLIAQCKREINPETTHIEIELFTTLGVCAGMIPYFDHNPSVSNTRQCAMGRKVMGNISYNQLSRMDTLMNLLVYPQRPLLTTRTAELVGYDKLGAGQNAIVAVMSDGYGSGNAIIMNKSSLDRGFGRCIVMKRYSAICRKYENLTSDRIVRPQREGKEAEIMQILDDDGLATPGEIIKPRDIYINKESPTITSSWTSRDRPPMRPSRQTYDGPQGETAVVDSVALYNDKHDNLCIKLMIRHTRRPEIGDTFCCRHGHKGVCGHIVQQEDFPFSESGICPDLIINPHGFPKELTVGKMMELLGSKAGALNGSFHYGTAFSEANHVDSVEAISKYLVMKKYNYGGKDFLYSGTLGIPIEAYIFTGPIYYQKLKHMVIDKMQAHATGKRSILTRQPIRGVRMGEMETGCLVSYGVSSVIYERLMISSDSYQAKVCKKCGLLGYTNHELQIGICSMCRNGDNIRTVTMPHALKLLIQMKRSLKVEVEGNTADETQTKGSAPNTSFVNDPPKKLKRTILCSHSSSGGSSRKTSEVWDHYSEIILSRLDYTSSNSKNENPN